MNDHIIYPPDSGFENLSYWVDRDAVHLLVEGFGAVGFVGKLSPSISPNIAPAARPVRRSPHAGRSGRGKKHFVKNWPDRMKRALELSDLVFSGTITGRGFIAEMHKVQPEPPIKSVQSFYNWKALGFDGLVEKTDSTKEPKA